MLNIDEIQNGIVIDHIKAGTAIGLMDLLGIKGNRTSSVALIQNARSHKAESGRKDIIKIEGGLDKVDLDILGYIDHTITVNIIKDDHIAEKKAGKKNKVLSDIKSFLLCTIGDEKQRDWDLTLDINRKSF